MKDKLFFFFASLAFLAAAFFVGRCTKSPKQVEVEVIKTDTVTVVDTLRIDRPVPYASRELKDSLRLMVSIADFQSALIDSLFRELGYAPMDTIAEIAVPKEQKEYKDDTYHAWVSGYQPSLDSIQVYQQTKYVINTVKEPPKHWHIGPMVGVGVGAADNKVVMTPYIGIGVTYSIFSF